MTSYTTRRSIERYGKNRSFTKIKHLRLVTPERANELGIPAEAPVLCSPYVSGTYRCDICNVKYTPLIYQIGQETEAQHFCKENGGGIYTQIPEDKSDHWQYNKGLFTALVRPQGPIRMGNDRGYQFRSVTPTKIQLVRCYDCNTLMDTGHLEFDYSTLSSLRSYNLVPICIHCFDPASARLSEWRFAINSTGELSFNSTKRLTLPDNAGVLKGRS